MEIAFGLIALCVWAIYVGVKWTRLALKRELNAESDCYDFMFLGVARKEQRKWLLSFVGSVWTFTFSVMLIAVFLSLFE